MADDKKYDGKTPQTLRSRAWFDNPSNPDMTALYLERYLNYGLTREELQSGKPIIGIAQTGSDLSPCNRHHLELAKRQKGAVINFGSLNGHIGVVSEVVYGCAKAAILHYTRCLALDMKPNGVRVNAISPGPTTTARFLATRATDPRLMDGVSLERYAKPQEIADAVAFLASDQAGFVNGQVLRVDGGMTLFA